MLFPRHLTGSLLLTFLAGAPTLAARIGPSFDCARATQASERAICTSTYLPTLDRRVAAAYAEARRVLGGEADTWLDEMLRADQLAWLRRRNRCGADDACLAREMRARAETLSLGAPVGAGPPSGRFGFRDAAGEATVLRLNASRALARLVTFQPQDGRWMCDVQGLVTAEGGRWVLRDPDGRALAELRPHGKGGLTVSGRLPLDAPTYEYCGLNGFFTGEYRRRAP